MNEGRRCVKRELGWTIDEFSGLVKLCFQERLAIRGYKIRSPNGELYLSDERVHQDVQVVAIPGSLQVRVMRAPSGPPPRRVHRFPQGHVVQLQRFLGQDEGLRQVLLLRHRDNVHDVGDFLKVGQQVSVRPTLRPPLVILGSSERVNEIIKLPTAAQTLSPRPVLSLNTMRAQLLETK